MPELPEVETRMRGIKPHIEDVKIVSMQIRQHRLRCIPDEIIPIGNEF